MKKLFMVMAVILLSAAVCTSCKKKDEPQDPTVKVQNLSEKGTANCYIVAAAGTYKFNATVKGNSTESVGVPAKAEVIWESFGTEQAPEVGDIIASVSLKDGFVQFSTPTTLVDGNALIAVKDSADTILWSWHIWVCNGFDPDATAQTYNNNAGIVMDRNLGATSAQPGDSRAFGLLYQWGRKDPFIGMCMTSRGDSTDVASTAVWPVPVVSDETYGTIEYSLQNPTTFIQSEATGDWYFTGDMTVDNTRWLTSDTVKGMYDPSPLGWRVADVELYSTAFGSGVKFYDGPWDANNRGMNFGLSNGQTINQQLGKDSLIWYPATGYQSITGVRQTAGRMGYIWTASPEGTAAACIEFDRSGVVDIYGLAARAYAYSIRCVKE